MRSFSAICKKDDNKAEASFGGHFGKKMRLWYIVSQSIKPALYTVDQVCRESVAMVVVDKGEVITLSDSFTECT